MLTGSERVDLWDVADHLERHNLRAVRSEWPAGGEVILYVELQVHTGDQVGDDGHVPVHIAGKGQGQDTQEGKE